MEEELEKDKSNSWVVPLPFKTPRSRLPNNRCQAMRRSLERNPEMKQHFFTFMSQVFHNNHAKDAPPLKEGEERWYLPLFGLYYPKKTRKKRVVFDSSAHHEDVSLNDVLLSGPDMNNTLLGVLMRFRKEAVAIIADTEQMFYCFLVKAIYKGSCGFAIMIHLQTLLSIAYKFMYLATVLSLLLPFIVSDNLSKRGTWMLSIL